MVLVVELLLLTLQEPQMRIQVEVVDLEDNQALLWLVLLAVKVSLLLDTNIKISNLP